MSKTSRCAILMAAAAAAISVSAPTVAAQSSITLFGQAYSVQRFNYAEQVQWPSVLFANETLQLVEVEGACYAGGNRLFASSEAMSEVFPGEKKNHVVAINLIESNGQITGIAYAGTIVVNDFSTDGYELSPSGLTINTGSVGIGAGGNLIVGSSEDNLRAYSLSASTLGQPLAVQFGQICQPSAASCALDLSGVLSDVEDVTYAPGAGGTGAVFVLSQEFPDRVLRLNDDGTVDNAGSFNVGGDIANPPAANPNPTPKGLSYLADSPAFPAMIRRPGGTLIVGLDDDGPGLQVFDLSGNLLAYESLTADGTPGGTSLLPLGNCAEQLIIESLASDPATGRLFLFNQGDGLTCNELLILTPVAAACSIADLVGGDGNPPADSSVDGNDFQAFLNAFAAGAVLADIVGGDGNPPADSSVDGNDFQAFLNAFAAGC